MKHSFLSFLLLTTPSNLSVWSVFHNQRGITLLLINFSRDTRISVQLSTISGIFTEEMDTVLKFSNAKELKSLIANRRKKRSRLEYHLTAKDGNLHSQTMLLNGKVLDVTPEGEIPSLQPVTVDADKRISVAPLSIAFVSLPDVQLPACSS